MKALRTSSYRKMNKGKLNDIYVYQVNGTVSELEAYKQAMLSRPNSPFTEANWAERGCDAKSGKPLHWLTVDLANGAIPLPSLNLTITQNGRIVVDNTIEKADKFVRMAAKMEDFEAQAIVDIKLGIRKVEGGYSPANSTNTLAITAPLADNNANEFHEDAAAIENKMLAGAEAGAETLQD